MCRLLFVKSNEKEFGILSYLEKFSVICKNSPEYQGHGWGLAYLDENNDWKYYKNIKPIWEDDLTQFSKTKRLLVHARSAFQDKDIVVENNMPFYDDEYVFIFNGELRGVRIKEEGRIGAEKIFNFIKKFNVGRMSEAFEKAISLIKKRTRQIKALNIIMADKEEFYINNYFTERSEYFTMYEKDEDDVFTICSMPFVEENGWKKIGNNSLRVYI